MKTRKTIYRILFVIYLCTVAYLCFGHFTSLPSVPNRILGFQVDKVVHFLMFFPFPLLFYLAFSWHSGKDWKSILFCLGTFAIGMLLAVGSELGQGLTTYRSRDIKDLRADCIALAACTVVVLIIDIVKNHRKCSEKS